MENNKNKEEEKGGDNDKVITVLEDNPCWGSRTRHRLEDLLSIIDRKTSIVYDSPQYLVLNKPPDLRMDGQYSATVHKLLTYWYPPPSLSSLGKCESKFESSTERESENTAENEIHRNSGSRDTLLLEAVSQLHQYNDVHDNFLRPCHQLDYATSGILLVAKTKEAAAHIGRLFEERHEGVQKSYTAVVVGDLRKGLLCNSKKNESEMSTKSSPKVTIWREGKTIRDLRERLRRLEETYRRSRVAAGKQYRRVRDASKSNDTKRKEKPSFKGSTFQGFQPAHSIFAKWRSKQKLLSAEKASIESSPATIDESSSLKKHKKRRKLKHHSARTLLTDNDWQQIWDPVNKAVEATSAAIDFEKLEWKQLHKDHHILKQAIVRATDIHNDILRDAIRNKEQNHQEEVGQNIEGEIANCEKELPILFRLLENSDVADNGDYDQYSGNNSDTDDSTFYVCCPLAQHPDQFNMVIPTSMVQACPDLTATPGYTTDRDNVGGTVDDKDIKLKFRPSLTKCIVLECGTLSRNNTETKVVVTKVRLFPMTGRRHQLRVHMALTGFPILGDVSYGGDRYVRRTIDESNGEEEKEMEIDACSRMCLHAQFLQLPTLLGESKPNWKIATSDPFVFGSDGKLQLH